MAVKAANRIASSGTNEVGQQQFRRMSNHSGFKLNHNKSCLVIEAYFEEYISHQDQCKFKQAFFSPFFPNLMPGLVFLISRMDYNGCSFPLKFLFYVYPALRGIPQQICSVEIPGYIKGASTPNCISTTPY